MKRVHISFVAIAAVICLAGIGCAPKQNPAAVQPTPTGSVSAKAFIGSVGSLAKTQAINLSKIYLEISAVGETTLRDSFNLSGSGSQSAEKVFANIKVKTWTAKAWTIDQQRRIIHSDSITFAVVENDTVDANLNLAANYSMMEAKFYPISDSATSAKIMVNGVVVVDSVFGKNASFDTLRLFFDYLPASPAPGTTAIIRLDVRGNWIDQDTLLWTGQKTIGIISGVDINDAINLAWVGPQVGGADMTVIIGRVGTVVVNGVVQPRPNTVP